MCTHASSCHRELPVGSDDGGRTLKSSDEYSDSSELEGELRFEGGWGWLRKRKAASSVSSSSGGESPSGVAEEERSDIPGGEGVVSLNCRIMPPWRLGQRSVR